MNSFKQFVEDAAGKRILQHYVQKARDANSFTELADILYQAEKSNGISYGRFFNSFISDNILSYNDCAELLSNAYYYIHNTNPTSKREYLEKGLKAFNKVKAIQATQVGSKEAGLNLDV